MTTSYFADDYRVLRQEKCGGIVTAIDDDGFFEVELSGSMERLRWFPPEALAPQERDFLRIDATVTYIAEVSLDPFGRPISLSLVTLNTPSPRGRWRTSHLAAMGIAREATFSAPAASTAFLPLQS